MDSPEDDPRNESTPGRSWKDGRHKSDSGPGCNLLCSADKAAASPSYISDRILAGLD